MPSDDRLNVYKVKYGPVMKDPDVPGTEYHTVIFVETSSNGFGYIHHVVGDLVTGMRYEQKENKRPEDSQTFYEKEFIGTVAKSSYPASVHNICRLQPPPHRQKSFNIKTMRNEPVKPDGSFYERDEPRPAMFKCTEWLERRAIPALQQAAVLEST